MREPRFFECRGDCCCCWWWWCFQVELSELASSSFVVLMLLLLLLLLLLLKMMLVLVRRTMPILVCFHATIHSAPVWPELTTVRRLQLVLLPPAQQLALRQNYFVWCRHCCHSTRRSAFSGLPCSFGGIDWASGASEERGS